MSPAVDPSSISCLYPWWHSDGLVSCLLGPGHGPPRFIRVSVCGARNASTALMGNTVRGMAYAVALEAQRPPTARWPVRVGYETPLVTSLRLVPLAGSGNPPLVVDVPVAGSSRPLLPLDPMGGETLEIHGKFFGDPLTNLLPTIRFGSYECFAGSVRRPNSSFISCVATPAGTGTRVEL